MRRMILALLFGFAALPPAAAKGDPPPERLIVEMALLRMVERLEFLANASFGPSVVHPQPEGRYWAVVGQAVSGNVTGNMHQHVYVAAIRLVCDDHANSDCWRLEKLAMDDRIVFDRGDPL